MLGGAGGANGGGPNGEPGADGSTGGRGGASDGGRGGPGASNGMRGFGGGGAHSASSPGGGGGGGYFGGGGGGSTGDTAVPTNRGVTESTRTAPMDTAGGGGGGSGYIAPSKPGAELSKAKIGPGSISGPGEIAISYTRPRTRSNTAVPVGLPAPAVLGAGTKARAIRTD